MEVPAKLMHLEGVVKVEKMLCEPCQGDNITTQADGLCKNCMEYMCNACFRQHLRVKLCKHHVLADVERSSLPYTGNGEDKVECKKHSGESVRFFCRKHEVVGCGDCMVTKHNACNSEYIKDITQNFLQSEEFQSVISKIENLLSTNKENEDKVQYNKLNNKVMLEKVLLDMRKFKIDINKYLDEIESDIISNAEDILSDNEKLLKKLEQDCQLISSKLDNIRKMLYTEMFKDNSLFIKTVECKPEVSEIEQAVDQVQSQHIQHFEFVCDEELHRIVWSRKSFGTLNISSATIRQLTMPSLKTEQDRIENDTKRSDVSNVNNDKKVKELRSAARVTVGARVRYNCPSGLVWTGTVNAVHSDGTVTVKWDNGRRGGPHRVGTTMGDVILI